MHAPPLPVLARIAANATPAGVPVGGAFVHVDVNSVIVLPAGLLHGGGTGSGHQSMSFAIPADPNLVGATVGAQWLISDTGLGNTFSATAAARLRLF